MNRPNSNNLSDSAANSLLVPKAGTSELIAFALEALPVPIYVFDQNRLLTRFNQAATTLHNLEENLVKGRRCCEMFWRVDGASDCIVDRGLQTREKAEVEILAGEEGKRSIYLIV